ncbi:hypothetical protein ACLOJK_038613 [Asimina triloba]
MHHKEKTKFAPALGHAGHQSDVSKTPPEEDLLRHKPFEAMKSRLPFRHQVREVADDLGVAFPSKGNKPLNRLLGKQGPPKMMLGATPSPLTKPHNRLDDLLGVGSYVDWGCGEDIEELLDTELEGDLNPSLEHKLV